MGKPFPSQAGLTHRQLVDVLLHFDFGSFQPLPQHLVVAGWYVHEVHTSLLQAGDLQGRRDPGTGQARDLFVEQFMPRGWCRMDGVGMQSDTFP